MSQQTITGPKRLRAWADGIQFGPQPAAISYPQSFRDLADAWESDVANALVAGARVAANVDAGKRELEIYLIETMKQIISLHEHRITECTCGQCYQARQALRVASEEIERRQAGGEVQP